LKPDGKFLHESNDGGRKSMSTKRTTDELEQHPNPQRLVSLDALRGFDMCLIAGGGTVINAIANSISPHAGEWMAIQTEHPEWNGYTPWDQIFPMFMFIAGVAMPFSMTRRLELGADKRGLHLQVIRPGLTLVLFGLIFQGLFKFEFTELRYPSVLGRIGLGYLFAGLIVLNWRLRGQARWAVGLLLGYWAAMKFIPVPGFGAGDWQPCHTLADYIDRLLVPGKLYHGDRDPEGLFSTLPAIVTVLSGVFAGHWLRSDNTGVRKTAGLFAGGVVCVVVGWLFDGLFPINKNLWSSSFVLWTSGWSAILFSAFYLVIDVLGWRRWAFFFVVIGANAITIYMARRFIDFGAVGELVFANAEKRVHPAIFASVDLMTGWLFLYVLYRKRIFLKV
jgi:predicted acyltransferase